MLLYTRQSLILHYATTTSLFTDFRHSAKEASAFPDVIFRLHYMQKIGSLLLSFYFTDNLPDLYPEILLRLRRAEKVRIEEDLGDDAHCGRANFWSKNYRTKKYYDLWKLESLRYSETLRN